MGTLSKSVGAYGGYLCASRNVCELARNRARTLGIRRACRPEPWRREPCARSDRDRSRSRAPALMLRANSQAHSACRRPRARSSRSCKAAVENALAASRRAAQRGFLVAAIRPPTVPPGTSRLRVTFSAEHSGEQVAALCGRRAAVAAL